MNKRRPLLVSIIFLSLPLCACGPEKESIDSVQAYKKSYSINQIKIAETNTFKKLNSVSYPKGKYPTQSEISNEEKEAYDNFSNLTYHSLVDNSNKKNLSYCNVGLYSLMNQMFGAVNRDDLKTRLDTLLGLNETNRTMFYSKLIKANSFADANSTIQLKNAAFFNCSYNYNPEFITYLTKLYCEAYQLDFTKDGDKIVSWVNKAVNDSKFINKKFLELSSDTELYLFSTYYFKNAWRNKYLDSDNKEDNFTLSNGSKVKATFMSHSYMIDSYYDYDKYISFKDYYLNGNASVTYIIPKSTKDDIFDLTKDVNIFSENDEKLVQKVDDYGYKQPIQVHLETPKFKLKSENNFKDSLSALGFNDIFDSNYDSFKNAFDDARLADFNIYLAKIKQKNEVEFNEDGTVIKSVSMAQFAKEGAVYISDTLDVKLNQPFIYIIRDINDTPVFVGHIDNPAK